MTRFNEAEQDIEAHIKALEYIMSKVIEVDMTQQLEAVNKRVM
jgi:hypothetical protein